MLPPNFRAAFEDRLIRCFFGCGRIPRSRKPQGLLFVRETTKRTVILPANAGWSPRRGGRSRPAWCPHPQFNSTSRMALVVQWYRVPPISAYPEIYTFMGAVCIRTPTPGIEHAIRTVNHLLSYRTRGIGQSYRSINGGSSRHGADEATE